MMSHLLRKILYVGVLATVAFITFVQVVRAECRYDGLTGDECSRVTALSNNWRGSAYGALQIVVAKPGGERDETAGACRYDEERHVVELTTKAFAFSDAVLTQCLATAFAQARYSEIEGQWLSHLGEHEAWVVREGKATKVSSSSQKVETAVARSLWSSLATRELIAAAATADTGRTIATSESGGEAPPSASDPTIAQLLGLDD